MVYELNNWLNNPSNDFALKNCLFNTVKLTKHPIKSKFLYNGWWLVFGVVAGSMSFCNGFSRNVINFGVDKSLSSHTDNEKNDFVVSSEEPTDDINDSVGTAEKKQKCLFWRSNW